MRRTVIGLVIGCCCLIAFASVQALGQSTSMDQLINDVQYAQSQSEKKVSRIKKEFASSDKKYRKAQDLYEDLASRAQSVSKTLALAVRQGRKPKGLDSLSQKVKESSTVFVKYANEILDEKGSIGIPAFVGVVKFFWDSFSQSRDKRRNEKAQQIVDDMAFPNWEDIKAAP